MQPDVLHVCMCACVRVCARVFGSCCRKGQDEKPALKAQLIEHIRLVCDQVSERAASLPTVSYDWYEPA